MQQTILFIYPKTRGGGHIHQQPTTTKTLKPGGPSCNFCNFMSAKYQTWDHGEQEIVENFPSPKTWEWNLPHSQIHNPSLHHSKSLLPSIMYVFPVNCWWVIYWFIPPTNFYEFIPWVIYWFIPPPIFTNSSPPFPALVIPYSSSKISPYPNFFPIRVNYWSVIYWFIPP